MATQESSILVKIVSALSAALDLATARADLDYQKLLSLANGTGANQANQVWHDQRTLTSGSNEELDLSGVLTNAVGESVTLTKVKAMLIKSADANTTDLTVGNATTNGFISWVGGATHTVTIKPGGVLLVTAPDANGLAVTAGTADKLKILNGSGASATYDIILIGVN